MLREEMADKETNHEKEVAQLHFRVKEAEERQQESVRQAEIISREKYALDVS